MSKKSNRKTNPHGAALDELERMAGNIVEDQHIEAKLARNGIAGEPKPKLATEDFVLRQVNHESLHAQEAHRDLNWWVNNLSLYIDNVAKLALGAGQLDLLEQLARQTDYASALNKQLTSRIDMANSWVRAKDTLGVLRRLIQQAERVDDRDRMLAAIDNVINKKI